MRFQVPQFIEVEDKIFGPLTVTQFIYLAGGVGFLVALLLVLPIWLAVILGGPIAVFGAALAFYKVNDRPFVVALQAGVEFFLRDKLYVWDKTKKEQEKIKPEEVTKESDALKYVPATTSSKIKDLSWSLDIKESLYSDEKQK